MASTAPRGAGPAQFVTRRVIRPILDVPRDSPAHEPAHDQYGLHDLL
ncbi:hypothetical protein H1D24_14640 [Streptomyces sp. PSKA28]|uniref:Uncharacterized protein n=1 Tax=Streptomyces himalayensis subsp. himalayensis TaxID=2756131 RepID=A0A7W0DMD5_9ACTN|nr:hypothetical protein [Streptomyces himalayensis subsp. himalayensis]